MTQVMLSVCELQDKGKRSYTEISTPLSEYLVIQVQEGIKSNLPIAGACLSKNSKYAGGGYGRGYLSGRGIQMTGALEVGTWVP